MKTIETKALELFEKCEIISLASIDENGFPRLVPLSKIKTEGLQTVWFATGTSSEKTKNFEKNNKAGISFFEGGNSIVETGTVEIVTDPETKKALWQDWFIEHFPKGITDPEYCILKFTGEKATLWIDGEFIKRKL